LVPRVVHDGVAEIDVAVIDDAFIHNTPTRTDRAFTDSVHEEKRVV
jgi:hypothetical protein